MFKVAATPLAVLLSIGATTALSESGTYELDPGHSQVLFSYNHIGFSETFGLFSGFSGEIEFDEDDPSGSSVTVSMPVKSMITGWDARLQHFMSDDFFSASDSDMVTFASTSIEVTGDNTANISGDLTMNGVTKPVVLETTLNKSAPYPFGPKEGTPTLGLAATATFVRSEFGLGAFAPAVSDEIELLINIEALKAE
ncbi:YceI family protein [Ruegeria sp. 6PALISEP08]|uniref:YceI family protein n=1 Tax=Ruegeria sp. 6PALISEP08 TaxID=1225660 RepID=UPI00067EB5FD|nr:YceI family protein [Ruegeria sp. 6PALISEP08]